MARKKRLTVEEVETALRVKGGRISHAAQYLGCTYQNVKYLVDKYPQLQETIESALNGLVDDAVEGLEKLVKQPHFESCRFVVRCHGKNRGWVEKDDNPAGPTNIQFNLISKMTNEEVNEHLVKLITGDKTLLELVKSTLGLPSIPPSQANTHLRTQL